MGKNYYCEYCDNRFKDDLNVRKRHLNGLPHQTAQKEHYAQFKSLEEILHEERGKRPCSRFPIGQCHFCAVCRFSHYTPLQLAQMQQQAEYEKQMRLNPPPKFYSKHLITDFLLKREQKRLKDEEQRLSELFKYPDELAKIVDEIPPSLRPLDLKALETNYATTFFGETSNSK